MRNNRIKQVSSIVIGICLVAVAGCSSTPAKFYQLSAMENPGMASREQSSQNSVVVAVGPVRMPDYLDRPQIVTRSSKNELTLSEFNRWAGSLDNDVIRVLAADVSAQLPADKYFVVQWSPLLHSQVPVAYKVEVVTDRFEGALGGAVTLHVQWAVLSKDKGLLYKKDANISEQVSGNGYGELVDAMSRAIERLSGDIAKDILSLGQPAQSK